MNNMITISSMSRSFRQTPVLRPNNNDVSGASFAECVQKEIDKQSISNDETIRSVDEYRTYLNDKLQNLSFDSSNRMDTSTIAAMNKRSTGCTKVSMSTYALVSTIIRKSNDSWVRQSMRYWLVSRPLSSLHSSCWINISIS